jgi:hypothetical protein
MLHRTEQPLLAELQMLERQAVTQYGRPLHAREVFDHLEAMRERAGNRIGYLVGKA